MSALDTHVMNTRSGPVSKHKVVNDVAHRHACDERCHKIGNDIKVQLQSIVRNLSVNGRVIGLILVADVRFERVPETHLLARMPVKIGALQQAIRSITLSKPCPYVLCERTSQG